MDRVLRSIEEAKERRARALALKDSGLTYEEIGDRMGKISHQRARQLVVQGRKERDERTKRPAEESA